MDTQLIANLTFKTLCFIGDSFKSYYSRLAFWRLICLVFIGMALLCLHILQVEYC